MMDIQSYYQSIAAEIAVKIGRLNALTSHGPSIGTFHESILKGVIRNLLPKRFGITSGIIVDDAKISSTQQDILIVDENKAKAYLFQEEGFSVVHYEAVVFAIEVKTRFNKRTFFEALNTCQSVARLGGSKNNIQKAIFFYYAGPINLVNLDKWYREVCIPDDQYNYPNHVVIFNRANLMLLPHKDDGTWGHHLLWDQDHPKKIDGDLLSVFLGTVRKWCGDSRKGFSPIEYSVLNAQRLTLSHSYFAFGKGAVPRDSLQNAQPEHPANTNKSTPL